jgi:uncharacterized protein YbjT (DUF2867 family)
MGKTAIVIGATGATGKELVQQLLENNSYSTVKIFVRRKWELEHPKLEVHVVDFDHPKKWKQHLTGDVLFSAMGTTLKAAGSKEAQYKIDFTYQYDTAKHATENDVKTFVLVSAAGASSSSSIFYSKMKGELEDAVKQLPFERIYIFQPTILDRNDKSRGKEYAALVIMKGLSKLGLLRKHRPMPVATLAEKMIKAANNKRSKGIHVFTLNKIFEV